jgi:hypothetical protein
MRAAREEGHLMAALRQFRAEIAAHRAGADDTETHGHQENS